MQDLQRKAAAIKLVVFDVDGVLTDGGLFIGDDGQEYKQFHSKDGHGMVMLQTSGVQIAILVGTLFVNVAVATYESHKGKQLDSELLLADATHTKADVFVTIGVLVGIVLSLSGLSPCHRCGQKCKK